MDPSHLDWIIGGIFKDLINFNPNLFMDQILIYNIHQNNYWKNISKIYLDIKKRDVLFFSSLTPLQNYLRIRPWSKNKKVLWFTHLNHFPSTKIIKCLNSTDLIYCHSTQIKDYLIRLGVKTKIKNIVGVIDPQRFQYSPKPGSKIAWVGSASRRKNPVGLLKFARHNPKLQFKVIGKNWLKDKKLSKIINELTNIEYIEIKGALVGSDFDFCQYYLMTSKIEGGPISLLEATAAGLIPICTNTGIARDLLTEMNYSINLISYPLINEEILSKLNNTFDSATQFQAIKIAKSYSVERLCKIFEKDVANLQKY